MRRIGIMLALLTLLVLAACGGGGDSDNEQQSSGGDDAPPVVDSGGDGGQDEVETVPDDGGAGENSATAPGDGGDGAAGNAPAPTMQMAPPVGQLATPAATQEVEFDPEDPDNEPAPDEGPPLTGFDYLYFQQEGGGADISIVIEIHSDGRVIRDGEELPVPQESIEELAATIDEVDFFNMVATFLGPPPDVNDYRYLLFVRRGGQERSIRAQDNYTPQEVQALFGQIRRISDEARRAAGA